MNSQKGTTTTTFIITTTTTATTTANNSPFQERENYRNRLNRVRFCHKDFALVLLAYLQVHICLYLVMSLAISMFS